VEVTEEYTRLRFSPHAISFLTDDLILQRYVEMDGQLRRVLSVVKMRGSDHSKDWRSYEITDRGLVVGEALSEYRGIMSGIPVRKEPRDRSPSGLTSEETAILRALEAIGEGTARAVAERSGTSIAEANSALTRSVELNYALRREEDGEPVFRMAARSLKG
jgi:hypothetical protein